MSYHTSRSSFTAFALLLSILVGGTTAYAATPPVNLGSVSNFVVLAGSAITNTGSSVVNGDIGLSPGSAVTGFPPGTLSGIQQLANAAAVSAQTDLAGAYTDAIGRTPVTTIGTELGGTTVLPGVYTSATGTFGLTGTVTLDAKGDPNAVFIFKTSSTLITAGASQILLTGGAQACNVFWQVGSSATLGANSSFKGYILALTSATLTTGANVEGGVFARNGAVTMDSNTVSKATCSTAPAPVVVSTPEPVATSTVTTTTPPVATSTVVVASTTTITTTQVTPVLVPTLPNTGYAPESVNQFWVVAVATVGILSLATLFVRRKKLVL